jgi:phage/plasmid-associated DNA primase
MSKVEDLKKARVETLLDLPDIRFIQFKGAALVSRPGIPGYQPLSSEWFSQMAYKRFGYGLSKGTIADLFHAVSSMATDWSQYDQFIGFHDRVWDAKKLKWDENQINHVYGTNLQVNDDPEQIEAVKQYLIDLADGDEELSRDYLQLLAPLLMYKKPVGIIWLLGAGANGKSSFLKAIHTIFGPHLASMTVEMIEDGRATPALRGVMGNVVLEASEKRVEDTQKYKAIGSHEPFPVRILGTHDVVSVDTNFHTLLNANNLPAFSDKTMGSRRRTLLVPFPATFKDDPDFDERTFTPKFLGALLHLVLLETRKIAKHGYQWSEASQRLQAQYNADANTAEAFARHLDEQNIVGLKNYAFTKLHYETWCAAEGVVALGRTHLKKAIETVLKPVAHSYKENGVTVRRLILPGYAPEDIEWLDTGYGFAKHSLEAKLMQLELTKGGIEKHDW